MLGQQGQGKSRRMRRLLSWWEGAVPGPTRRALGQKGSLGDDPGMKVEEGGALVPTSPTWVPPHPRSPWLL